MSGWVGNNEGSKCKPKIQRAHLWDAGRAGSEIQNRRNIKFPVANHKLEQSCSRKTSTALRCSDAGLSGATAGPPSGCGQFLNY